MIMCTNNFLIILLILAIMISFYLCILALHNKIECWTNSHSSRYHNIEEYNEIIPNLYIGNIDSAQNLKFIKDKKIKVIINCSNSIPNYFQYDTNIEYFRLAVDDSLLEDDINLMTKYLPDYVNIIDRALSQNKPVLVHCYAGRQRSACLIAAYLIYKYKYSIEDVYKYIISKRKEAFHYGRSYNFNRSLLEYTQLIK